ncbi:hypothetical protein VTO42DRAFT_2473 [Malbranchea cinnamomea]
MDRPPPGSDFLDSDHRVSSCKLKPDEDLYDRRCDLDSTTTVVYICGAFFRFPPCFGFFAPSMWVPSTVSKLGGLRVSRVVRTEERFKVLPSLMVMESRARLGFLAHLLSQVVRTIGRTKLRPAPATTSSR